MRRNARHPAGGPGARGGHRRGPGRRDGSGREAVRRRREGGAEGALVVHVSGQYDWIDRTTTTTTTSPATSISTSSFRTSRANFRFSSASEASLDLLGAGDTPLLMFRLESPTSTRLGSQIEDPFFNQRALLVGRLPGFDLDLRYRRMRTEDTRVFPNTATPACSSTTRAVATGADAERTGFAAELRARMDELLDPEAWLDRDRSARAVAARRLRGAPGRPSASAS